ncbi:flagellar assembly peptidoglycan hydrolase FlgJ [Glaciecola sp. 2405UD65-10]|jgi:flagellar protein FlgJ|uniref:flagellar assembly peptidoglycan hydrolase FlgJ n=1 Tax=Glaciecola sp. 2405UD65-10 TaxID=3397244 RepID=UPI003B5913C3
MDNMASTTSQLEMSRSVHDLGSLDTLRAAAKSGDDGALEEAAKQFEAIFVQMLLKSMRQAQDAIADKDSPFNSDQVKFYRDMHDQQLATNLSTNGSIGLADVIVQQMGINNGVMPSGAVRSDGDLSILNRERVLTRQQNEDAILGAQGATKAAVFDTPKAFVENLYPQALEAAEKLNIDPKALIAQAAVETGWGKHVIQQSNANSTHNLFGIKADSRWQGEKAVVDTLEYVNQLPERQRAAFRSYQDFASSLNDYADFVQSNPRYEQALEKTQSPNEYFSALQEAGYATDPKYADKVMSVYEGSLLNDLMPE